MSNEKNIDRQLQLLGQAVAPEPSFVESVMFRISQTQVAPRRTSVSGWNTKPLRHFRVPIAVACLIALAFVGTFPFGGHSERGAGWWLGSSSAYAQELVTALDKALPGGVIAREQTTFMMPDGGGHVSSTKSTFFLSPDAYRRDIYDENRLRETQWYVPNADGMTQTSVRWEAGTYQIDKHPEPAKGVNRIAQLQSIVKSVERADRRLNVEEIEGKKCIGFEIAPPKAEEPKSGGTCRVWFDAETKLPVRIETELPKSDQNPLGPGIQGIIITQDRFDWNPRLPGNTFIPSIPEGFRKVSE